MERDGFVCQAAIVVPYLAGFVDFDGYDDGRTKARFGKMEKQCGAPATHVDHIVPKAQGGTDEESNLQALCAHHHAVKTGKERR